MDGVDTRLLLDQHRALRIRTCSAAPCAPRASPPHQLHHQIGGTRTSPTSSTVGTPRSGTRARAAASRRNQTESLSEPQASFTAHGIPPRRARKTTELPPRPSSSSSSTPGMVTGGSTAGYPTPRALVRISGAREAPAAGERPPPRRLAEFQRTGHFARRLGHMQPSAERRRREIDEADVSRRGNQRLWTTHVLAGKPAAERGVVRWVQVVVEVVDGRRGELRRFHRHRLAHRNANVWSASRPAASIAARREARAANPRASGISGSCGKPTTAATSTSPHGSPDTTHACHAWLRMSQTASGTDAISGVSSPYQERRMRSRSINSSLALSQAAAQVACAATPLDRDGAGVGRRSSSRPSRRSPSARAARAKRA